MYSYTSLYSSVLPTGVACAGVCSSNAVLCTCAYVVCWSCRGGLATESVANLLARVWGQGPASLLVLGWGWRCSGVPWGLLRVWTFSQSIWDVGLSPVFPTGMVCACAYVVCWCCQEGLAKGKMFMSLELGGRVGLAGTEPSGWQGWGHSLTDFLLIPQNLLSTYGIQYIIS